MALSRRCAGVPEKDGEEKEEPGWDPRVSDRLVMLGVRAYSAETGIDTSNIVGDDPRENVHPKDGM
jgi:hypothetical protein